MIKCLKCLGELKEVFCEWCLQPELKCIPCNEIYDTCECTHYEESY